MFKQIAAPALLGKELCIVSMIELDALLDLPPRMAISIALCKIRLIED